MRTIFTMMKELKSRLLWDSARYYGILSRYWKGKTSTKLPNSTTQPKQQLPFKSFITLYQETGMKGLTIEIMMRLVTAWADQHISKNRTYENAIAKMMLEELPEFLQDPCADEWADVMIIWLDVAKLQGIDPEKAVMDKLMRNLDREFKQDKGSGIFGASKSDTPDSKNDEHSTLPPGVRRDYGKKWWYTMRELEYMQPDHPDFKSQKVRKSLHYWMNINA